VVVLAAKNNRMSQLKRFIKLPRIERGASPIPLGRGQTPPR
jgi:hypothetical protein